jgi:hypothetical protein
VSPVVLVDPVAVLSLGVAALAVLRAAGVSPVLAMRWFSFVHEEFPAMEPNGLCRFWTPGLVDVETEPGRQESDLENVQFLMRAFFEANLALTDAVPTFIFFWPDWPHLHHAALSAGQQGQRNVGSTGDHRRWLHYHRRAHRPGRQRDSKRDWKWHQDSQLCHHGADFYPEEAPKPKSGNPMLGIGRHCHIEGAIIDKNARIGEGAVITSKGKSANADCEDYCIRDGIVVVPKGAVITAGNRI